MLAHVVDAEHRRASLVGQHGDGDASGEGARERAWSPSTRPRKRLRDAPTSTGRPSATISLEPRQKLEVVLDGLPEADPRVEADPLLARSRLDIAAASRSSRKATTSETTSS